MFDRRTFNKRSIAYLGFGLLAPIESFGRVLGLRVEPFPVTISIKPVPGYSMKDFDTDKKEFENTEALLRVIDAYKKAGRILKIDLRLSDSELFVEYVFDSKRSFLSWNQVVCDNRYFRRDKVPAKYVMVGSED